MQQKVKITVAYDGADFHGFARQQGLRTVQGELERLLSLVMGQQLEVYGASRTDAGVHAKAQIVHVTVDEWLRIPVSQWCYVMRYRTTRDLQVIDAQMAPADFHARHTAHWKQYRYTIDTSYVPDVFQSRYAAHIPFALDVAAMQEASFALVGKHDFTSFCSGRAQQESKVRTVHAIEVYRNASFVCVDITGNAFLHNMVRIIVGTLVQVGLGRLTVGAVETILKSCDRRQAGPTAPAQGLCLWHVEYPAEQHPSDLVT